MADICKDCGCMCKQCNKQEQKHNDMHLHVEIENLRQRIVERDNHIVTMETQFLNEAEKFPNGELASLKEEMIIWQDKYTRLCESHKRIQKVNQNLEDKLLRIVDKCETEKGAFTKDIATLSHKLADANYIIHQLTQDNANYRNDVNLAIQLLQCKPTNFIGQKYETLPPEVQAKVRNYVAQKGHISELPNSDMKSITVPISTFPPTAMVYNVAKPMVDHQDINNENNVKPPIDMVSATVMAKVLEDREKERIFAHHCNTCTCYRSVLKVDNESQTTLEQNKSKFPSAKDYCKEFDYNELKNKKNTKESSYSDTKDVGLSFIKGHSEYNNSNTKHDTYCCDSDITKLKLSLNNDNIKTSTRKNFNDIGYLNLKNSNNRGAKNEANINYNSKSMDEAEKTEGESSALYICKKSTNDGKLSKELKDFDDQAKIDMINERLWKSNWINSKCIQSTKESEIQLEVINDRVWKNNNRSSDKSAAPFTVIDIQSGDDLTNENDKMHREPTTSPSFSGDSIIISSSDPSSVSSDLIFHQAPSISKKEGASGPRNCLMRVTNNSKNILLDNAGTYQTVLYTSGCSRPSTALVHIAKSSRSGRSASISSEENAPSSIQESAHLQRVAQWVDTLSSDCHPQNIHASNTFQHSPFNGNVKSKELGGSLTHRAEQQPDLITFVDSADNDKCAVDYIYQDSISKEAYIKLAKSLDPANLRLTEPENVDPTTVGKYRNESKDSHSSSQANFHFKT